MARLLRTRYLLPVGILTLLIAAPAVRAQSALQVGGGMSPLFMGSIGDLFGPDDDAQVRDESPDQEADEPDAQEDEQETNRRVERAKKADENFDNVMQQNAIAPAMKAIRGFAEINVQAQAAASASATSLVDVPLKEFVALRDRLNKLRTLRARQLGPAVVLGAASYSGEARPGGLSLKLELQVTLGQPDRFKAVPLVGDDVVVAKATVAGQALSLTRQNGYHVWMTKKTGEVAVSLELWVPARGPRGSIEYDFLVARTPVTRFSCRFPVPGLEPRLSAAVQAGVRTVGNATLLDATLEPTTHIHLVGFREIGETEGREKKVYAETLNLLSIDEGMIDLFTVVRYTILYAGTKEFRIMVPSDMTVMSADGEGAFRFELERSAAGTLIKGETAYPIRNGYEISIRLHRAMAKKGERFAAPLVRCVGVEREQGYLAVEVPGKLQLEETERQEALAIDVRQLPGEMVQSAVSPILKAYRYHTAGAKVGLNATRLPEREPASAFIDRIRAFTVVAEDGQILTDMRITLRNRLLPSLGVMLPKGTEVRSTLLDGEPVKPSKDDKGRLMLPLKRSEGGDTLSPFTVQVVVSTSASSLGLWGRPSVELPAVELPASSVAWSLFLPAKNRYGRLRGEIEPQELVGTASWHQPHGGGGGGGGGAGHPAPGMGQELHGAGASSADTGAMPVRIKLPESGVRLEYNRYWLNAAEPVSISFWYLRSWLRLPFGLLFILLMAAGLVLWSRSFTFAAESRQTALLGVALVLSTFWPLWKLAHATGMALAVLMALGVLLVRSGAAGRCSVRFRDWATTLGARFTGRKKSAAPWTAGRVLWRMAVGGALALVLLFTVVFALGVLSLLFRPLSG